METAALIKFGSYEHLCSLRDSGEIYMNTLPYFRSIEDNELRGDSNESVDEIQRGSDGYITIPSTGQRIQVTDFVLRIGPDNPENITLFCMYAMRPKYGTYPIDKRNFKFGSHALIFFKSQELINRISIFIKKNSFLAKAGLVEYLDVSHIGEVGSFKKLKPFGYQSEWRLVCNNTTGKEQRLTIGSLKDICTLVKADNVNNEIMFTPYKAL